MTHYIKSGTRIFIRDADEIDLGSTLPVGTYIVERDPRIGFYLVSAPNFKTIDRYYGNTLEMSERIIKTFRDREDSTGVMLTGEKGSGKTLLAKHISYTCREDYEMSTIIVNTAFVNTETDKSIQDAFLKFMQSIDVPCVILFDEFEKMYDYTDDQSSILTLLDGLFATNKLFVFTCNDKYKIDRHLRNRPSRIYYMIDYTGLDETFISEYLEENLENKSWSSQVLKLTNLFSAFNFDMLQSVVEEVNRYDIDPVKCIDFLNVKPENDSGGHKYWTVESLFANNEDWGKYVKTKQVYHDPLKSSTIEIDLSHPEYESLSFEITDIISYDAANSRVVYSCSNGDKLVITATSTSKWKVTDLL